MPRKQRNDTDESIETLVARELGLYTYDLAAAELRLRRETVRQYGQRGVLKRVYLDQQALITRDSIRAFEESRE